jgi:hypothetical protein
MEMTLEAARKQKILNLQLKTACLENEEAIQEIHLTDWSEQPREKLAAAHAKGAELLADAEARTRWNLTTAYDFAKLQKLCGLEMSVRDLFQPDDKPQFMDVLALKQNLQELKNHRNKARLVSFTGTIDNALSKLEKVEEELRKSKLDATDLAQVPVAVLKNLEDCMNVQNVQAALLGNEEQITQQLASVEKCDEIRDIAVRDGEMQIAEEQYHIKAQLLERLLDLVRDKFRIIGTTEEENKQFSKIHEVQKKANQDTSAMKDARRRLKQRTEADMKNLQDAVQKADLEDLEAQKAFAEGKAASEKRLQENLEKQDECWRKIQALLRELQRLGSERYEEVRRRLDDNDREEKRKVEYEQFLSVTSQHRQLLELTVYNCDLAVRTISLIEELVAEGCQAIKQRYDKTNQELADLRLLVHQEYLGVFRRLYKTLNILTYKKEKTLEEIDRQIRQAHIQLEMCIDTLDPNAKKYADLKKDLYRNRSLVENEVAMLKEKMRCALEDFAPTEEALQAAGIEYRHPVDEAEEGNLERRAKLVEYRAHLAKQEEVKIAAEREELKLAKTLALQQKAANSTLRLTQSAGGSPPRIGNESLT